MGRFRQFAGPWRLPGANLGLVFPIADTPDGVQSIFNDPMVSPRAASAVGGASVAPGEVIRYATSTVLRPALVAVRRS